MSSGVPNGTHCGSLVDGTSGLMSSSIADSRLSLKTTGTLNPLVCVRLFILGADAPSSRTNGGFPFGFPLEPWFPFGFPFGFPLVSLWLPFGVC